jgi:hypothetical protein
MLVCSCGSGTNTDSNNEKTENKKSAKSEKKEMTIELYSKIVNERRALLMEKYWPKFKENNKEENQKLFKKYIEEEKDILENHGFARDYDLSRYFRKNMKEVMKYQKTNPEFVEYPEYGEAKRATIDLAMSNAMV